MSRIRVLRVITRMNIGGPAIHAALLTTRLDPRRFETLLVTGRIGADEASMLELGRVDLPSPPRIVAALGRAVSPLADLRALVEVTSIVRAYRPHIVHTHMAKAGFMGRVAARLAGTNVVVHTYHGSVFHSYFGRTETQLFVWIERSLARLSSRLIAISARQRGELIGLGIAPPDKVIEIPLGLDLGALANAPEQATARVRLGIPVDAAVVALVARLVPVKDVPSFLRALSKLRPHQPGLRALIVGDGSERRRLESLASELGVADICSFVGWQPDVATVYAAADVIVLSSLNEGSPVSLIEAMSVGRSIVATAVGGVPDVVRDQETGLLVPPRDPEALAEAMRMLLGDAALRERLGEAGRAASRRFSADRLVSDVERLYETLLVQSAT